MWRFWVAYALIYSISSAANRCTIALSFGKMRTTSARRLLVVQSLEHVRAMDLHPVFLREVYEGQHLVVGGVDHGTVSYGNFSRS